MQQYTQPHYPMQPGQPGYPQPKTSGMAIASLVCGIIGCLGITGLIGLIMGIIALRQINGSQGAIDGSGLAIAGIVTSALGMFVSVGILASMFLPALAKAKNRANRIKCVNNIKQVGGALNAFADDNKNRYPWLLQWKDQVAEQGGAATASTTAFYETGSLFAQAGVKSGFGGSQKILASPCDPDVQGSNDLVDLSLAHHANNPIPNNAHSYGVVTGAGWAGVPDPDDFPDDKGADVLKPSTTLMVTRNISAESLSDGPTGNPATGFAGSASLWLGADVDSTNPRVMAGLNMNQGQAAGADGSGSQSNNADLSNRAKAHNNAKGGNYRGIPSPVLDTPND